MIKTGYLVIFGALIVMIALSARDVKESWGRLEAGLKFALNGGQVTLVEGRGTTRSEAVAISKICMRTKGTGLSIVEDRKGIIEVKCTAKVKE